MGVKFVEDDAKQLVPPGPWRDVDEFAEVIVTAPEDKVLALCVLQYTANWSIEMNRGRFTIARDDFGLDGIADRGLQSVRALGPDRPRALLMAVVDDPPPGPHLYRVRSATTADEGTGIL